MGKVQSELFSLGFQQNRASNWSRGHDIVQVVRSSEFSAEGRVRITWREEWKDYLAILFDYTAADGPICIVPVQVFFGSSFVSEKRKELSYANSGYYWSQLFPFNHVLTKMVLSYENRWDVLGGQRGKTKDWPIPPEKQSARKTHTKEMRTNAQTDQTSANFVGMLKAISDQNLLHLYCDLMEELREREIVRSGNNPVSDYGEKLIAEGMNLKLTAGSNKGYDGIDEKTGKKYQIKSRRVTKHNQSRQLGVIRNLDQKLFDYLIAVIFDEYLTPREIWQIPIDLISRYAKFSEHQNGHILILTGNILQDEKIKRLL